LRCDFCASVVKDSEAVSGRGDCSAGVCRWL
jgi:hypothetical protein